MNDFEMVRGRLCDHHTREYEWEAQAALDRIEAERDELLARLGRMEGEYQAAPRMILERDAEVERQQETLHVAADRENDLRLEVERLEEAAVQLTMRADEYKAEIERLRAEYANLLNRNVQLREGLVGNEHLVDEVERLRAENERLKTMHLEVGREQIQNLADSNLRLQETIDYLRRIEIAAKEFVDTPWPWASAKARLRSALDEEKE
jgi:chromosome segregation ATPase